MNGDPFNQVLMYGAPPDMPSPRFKPEPQVVPGQVGPLQPFTKGTPPVTHNPFTGEPVNLLEVLAQNALLIDENKRLKEFAEKQLEAIKELQQKVTTLTIELIPQRKKTGVPCCSYAGCNKKPLKNLTMCRKHQPFPAKKR